MASKTNEQTSHEKMIARVNRSVKKIYKSINFRLHKVKDKELIDFINSSSNKTDLIREALNFYYFNNFNNQK